MPVKIEYTKGQRINKNSRLVYIRDHECDSADRKAEFLCDCGGIVITIINSVKRGLTKSCGCLNDEVRAEKTEYKKGDRLSPGSMLVFVMDVESRRRKALFICDCGNEHIATIDSVKRELTKSCGCFYHHGMVGTPEYKSWAGMIQRCTNAKDKRYTEYGGRGISVCDEWISFKAFYSSMGDKPGENYSIDRIDNNGNYEPGNCRWATKTQQSRNTRSNVIIKYNGETKCLKEWSETLGLGYKALWYRINCGWTVERAFTTPIRKW